MLDTTELTHHLRMYTGTTQWFRNQLYPTMLYTEGVQFFAEHADAYWFLDIVGTEIHPLQATVPFMHITFSVTDDNTATIIATDGGDGAEPKQVYYKDMDFALATTGDWKFFLTDNVLLLPSEY